MKRGIDDPARTRRIRAAKSKRGFAATLVALAAVLAASASGGLGFAEAQMSTSSMYTGTTGATTTGTGAVEGTAATTSAHSGSSTTSSQTTLGSTPSSPTVAPMAPMAYPAPGTTPAPLVLEADAAGRVLIRGSIEAAGADSLMVRTWGGVWTIRTVPGSVVIPSAASTTDNNQMAAMRVGDFVGASGLVAADQPFTVNAAVVRDWTLAPSSAMSALSSSSSTPSYGKLYVGTAGAVNAQGGDSFMLTDAQGAARTVTTDASTTLWDRTSKDIPFSSILAGDAIRLDGTLMGDGTIAASVVRDTSIPRAPSSTPAAGGGASTTPPPSARGSTVYP